MSKNGFSEPVSKYCSDHWRDSTARRYRYVMNPWFRYHSDNVDNIYNFSPGKCIDYLVYLFEKEKKTISCINAAFKTIKSLCTAVGKPFSRQEVALAKMVIQGMFLSVPVMSRIKPRQSKIWDVQILFDFFENGPLNKDMPIRDLSGKLACMIMLATIKRAITLTALDLNQMTWSDQKTIAKFILTKLDKIINAFTSPRNKEQLDAVFLKQLPVPDNKISEKKLCPVRCLKVYLARTPHRASSKLFITCTPPFKAATKQTICNWMRDIMAKAGINTTHYAPGSFRHASSSSAIEQKIPVFKILKRAGWRKQNTFVNHYLKDVDRIATNSDHTRDPEVSAPHIPPPSGQVPYQFSGTVKQQENNIKRHHRYASYWEESDSDILEQSTGLKSCLKPINSQNRIADRYGQMASTTSVGSSSDNDNRSPLFKYNKYNSGPLPKNVQKLRSKQPQKLSETTFPLPSTSHFKNPGDIPNNASPAIPLAPNGLIVRVLSHSHPTMASRNDTKQGTASTVTRVMPLTPQIDLFKKAGLIIPVRKSDNSYNKYVNTPMKKLITSPSSAITVTEELKTVDREVLPEDTILPGSKEVIALPSSSLTDIKQVKTVHREVLPVQTILPGSIKIVPGIPPHQSPVTPRLKGKELPVNNNTDKRNLPTVKVYVVKKSDNLTKQSGLDISPAKIVPVSELDTEIKH